VASWSAGEGQDGIFVPSVSACRKNFFSCRTKTLNWGNIAFILGEFRGKVGILNTRDYFQVEICGCLGENATFGPAF